jgi:ribosomal protein S18 acetylase RimI-like enzyme
VTGRPVAQMKIERLRRLGAELLTELSRYDHEAFGPTGLRPFDLALVAWTGRLYLGRVEGQVAASCQLLRMLDRPHLVWIVGFYVRPEWQGRGLGRQMLEWVLAELPSFGARGIEMTVVPGNDRALKLYFSAGFEQVDEVPEMYGAEEHRVMLRYEREEAS